MSFDFNFVQDQRGFLWVPSLNGLNRFDGREFKVFRYEKNNPNGLSTNFINTVFVDRAGKIWIGTRTEGINIYDPETETFEYIRHDPADPESLCGYDVRSINQDREGNHWIGTVGQVACRCKEGERTFTTYPGVGSLGYLQQENGTIWRGGAYGLHRYLPEQDTFILYIPHPGKDFRYNGANALAEGPDGEVWITSKRRTQLIFNPETETFRDFPGNTEFDPGQAAYALHKDRNGDFWLGGFGRIARYDAGQDRIEVFEHDIEDPTSCQNERLVSHFSRSGG